MFRLTPKSELTASQLADVESWLPRSEAHTGDPASIWWRFPNNRGFYALVDDSDGSVVGLAEASQRPIVVPAWSIRRDRRRQGIGTILVDMLAARLKMEGIIQVAKPRFQGDDLEASHKLWRRFEARFADYKKN